MKHLEIRKGSYFDSVHLMSLSAQLGKLDGLSFAQLVLATSANLALLRAQGFAIDAAAELTPTDLIIALQSDDATNLAAAQQWIGEQLRSSRGSTSGDAGRRAAYGLDGALDQAPQTNLVLISVPGDYAGYEAQRALQRGLNVMIFSDNVPPDEERALKDLAHRSGLLVMGPDCGTAMIDGVPLGFCNAVRPGSIGLVGASGTGLQEVACQIDRAGGGVRQIIGTGGRDLKAAIGGRTTIDAIARLARDDSVEVIALISKPPDPPVAKAVLDALSASKKPAVCCFCGATDTPAFVGIEIAPTLHQAALSACRLAGINATVADPAIDLQAMLATDLAAIGAERSRLQGLFCGGTLAAEALAILRTATPIASNLDQHTPQASHRLIDTGDDQFTRGRPHPMIEPRLRNELIARLPADTAVLLVDVVLGYGAHADPSGVLLEALDSPALRGSLVVASLTGTDRDPQLLSEQSDKLQRAGVRVLQSNAQAASYAAELLERLEQR